MIHEDKIKKQVDLVSKIVANKISPVPNSTLWNWGYNYAKMGIEEWLAHQELTRHMLETPAPQQKVFIPKLPNI